jgi:5-methylcytosine-specific restriction endonuclease McrA
MRFTKKDKKLIAQLHDQEDWVEDEWSGEVYLAGYICRKCRVSFPSIDYLEVDHIIPVSRRGTDRPSNLQLLCPKCNKRKGSKIKGKATTIKRKTRTVKRKVSTAKRKSSTIKRKGSAAKRRRSTVQRKRR